MCIVIILTLQILFYALYVDDVGSVDFFSKFHQQGYKSKDLRGEVSYYNKKYMHYANFIGHKFNRSTVAFNFTFYPKINLEDKVEIVVQAFKRASNEYRLFPMRFEINMCKTFQSNVAGLKNIQQYGNFTTCNWKKDTLYYANNVYMDDSHLPPLIPFGEYKIQNELILDNIILVTLNAYAEFYSANKRN